MGMRTTHEIAFVSHRDGLQIRCCGDGTITYDEVVEVEAMSPAQASIAARQMHFDYAAQRWVDGQDHAHTSTTTPAAPLMWCNVDRTACHGALPPGARARL